MIEKLFFIRYAKHAIRCSPFVDVETAICWFYFFVIISFFIFIILSFKSKQSNIVESNVGYTVREISEYDNPFWLFLLIEEMSSFAVGILFRMGQLWIIYIVLDCIGFKIENFCYTRRII